MLSRGISSIDPKEFSYFYKQQLNTIFTSFNHKISRTINLNNRKHHLFFFIVVFFFLFVRYEQHLSDIAGLHVRVTSPVAFLVVTFLCGDYFSRKYRSPWLLASSIPYQIIIIYSLPGLSVVSTQQVYHYPCFWCFHVFFKKMSFSNFWCICGNMQMTSMYLRLLCLCSFGGNQAASKLTFFLFVLVTYSLEKNETD